MNTMRRRVLSGCLLTLLGACGGQERSTAAAGPTTTPWLLGETPDLDAIHASDTEAALVVRYGRSAVVRGRVSLGEGETEPGTILFPHDATRRLQIRWADTIAFAHPVLAIVTDSVSRWQVYPGVGLHTTLHDLERLNARPFVLSGMEWDYAGTVVSWEQGTLDDLWSPGDARTRLVSLRLSRPGYDTLTASVSGDRDFRSDHPAMSALDPRVYEMAIAPRSAAGTPARPQPWRIDLVDSVVFQHEMASGFLRRVRVIDQTAQGRDSVDTLAGVLVAAAPVALNDSVLIGIRYEQDRAEGLFAYDRQSHRVQLIPPPSGWVAYATPALSPDGRHVAYLAQEASGRGYGAVAELPEMRVVYRGVPVVMLETDAGVDRIRWSDATQYEIRIALTYMTGGEQRIRGSLAPRRVVIDTVPSPP